MLDGLKTRGEASLRNFSASSVEVSQLDKNIQASTPVSHDNNGCMSEGREAIDSMYTICPVTGIFCTINSNVYELFTIK